WSCVAALPCGPSPAQCLAGAHSCAKQERPVDQLGHHCRPPTTQYRARLLGRPCGAVMLHRGERSRRSASSKRTLAGKQQATRQTSAADEEPTGQEQRERERGWKREESERKREGDGGVSR